MKTKLAPAPMATNLTVLNSLIPAIERLMGSQWYLKLKHHPPVTGHFVQFTVWRGVLGDMYPQCSDLHFAFCPSSYMDEFRKDFRHFNEIPKYILLFYKSEIEELKFHLTSKAGEDISGLN